MRCVLLSIMKRAHRFFHLGAQGQALLDTETMLLINHRQTQIIKTHRLLNQSVRAHEDMHLTLFERVIDGLLVFLAHTRCQPRDIHMQRREPFVQLIIQLFSKNLSRCHHRALFARIDALRTRQCRDYGFT